MHRQIMQPPPGMVVDHVDGSQANNCRFNLRVCTRAENIRNKRKHAGSISTYKGVFYNRRRRKWFSQCWFKGKCHATRYVDEEVEAARAYDRQAVECFGEYARLNFPQEWPPERRAQIHAEREARERQARPSPAPSPRRRPSAKDAQDAEQPPSANKTTIADNNEKGRKRGRGKAKSRRVPPRARGQVRDPSPCKARDITHHLPGTLTSPSRRDDALRLVSMPAPKNPVARDRSVKALVTRQSPSPYSSVLSCV